jgi:hypothetical protein
LEVQEISGTSIEEGLRSTPLDTQDIVLTALQDQDIGRYPTDISEAAESPGKIEEGSSPTPFHSYRVIPIGLQDKGAQPSPKETQEAPQIPKSKTEMLDSNDEDLPDEVPAIREKHAPEDSSPVDPEIQQEKEKSPASSVEPPLLAPDSILKEETSSIVPTPLAAAPLKRLVGSLPARMLPWATGEASSQPARRKTDDAKRDTQKMGQKKDDLPETAQKALDRRDTGKAPASVSTTNTAAVAVI